MCVHEQLPGEELETTVKEYAARDHTRWDCLVVIILSHGFMGGVYGADGCPVKLKDLTTPFQVVYFEHFTQMIAMVLL